MHKLKFGIGKNRINLFTNSLFCVFTLTNSLFYQNFSKVVFKYIFYEKKKNTNILYIEKKIKKKYF